MIDDVEIARALHVVFVAHWIGGVAFVTLVALPLARASRRRWERLGAVRGDRKPLRGAGSILDSARRRDRALDGVAARSLGPVRQPAAWWMDAMVLLWALFMLIVFVIEPLAHRRVAAMAAHDPAASSSGFRASIAFCSRRGPSRSSAPWPARTEGYSDDRGSRPGKPSSASRAWRGAPVLSRGFRLFFLAAGAWALIGMALWLPVFTGAITIPTAFSAVDWHAHEMIFGYAGAVSRASS